MSIKPKRNKTLLYLLGALFVGLIIFAAIKARQKPKGEEVTVEKVQKRTIKERVSASGKIFPETEVKISSDASGEVVELYVKEGDSVTIGQVLAKIKPDEYQSELERGEAALKSAQAQREISTSNVNSSSAQIEQMKAERKRVTNQLETARNTHKRNEQLYKEGVISAADYESSQNNLRAAEAGLAASEATLKAAEAALASADQNVNVAGYGITSAKATVKQLRTSLQKTIVTAPVSGIISKLNIEKGERVVGTLQMAGTEMMRIANLHSMEVQVDVSENDILKVSLGDEVDVEVDAYLGRKFKGKVSEIANSASNLVSVGGQVSLNTDQVTNFIVKVRIAPDSYSDLIKKGQRYPFRPGMSANIDIFTEKVENALSVPIMAVTAREDKKKEDSKKGQKEEDEGPKNATKKEEEEVIKEIVFVVVGDTVAVREVKTGVQDSDHIEILSGLTDEETVVVGPYSAIAKKLESGKPITIKTTDKSK